MIKSLKYFDTIRFVVKFQNNFYLLMISVHWSVHSGGAHVSKISADAAVISTFLSAYLSTAQLL